MVTPILYGNEASVGAPKLSDLALAFQSGRQNQLQNRRAEIGNRTAEIGNQMAAEELKRLPKKLDQQEQAQEMLIKQYGFNNVKNWTDFAVNSLPQAKTFVDFVHVMDVAKNKLGMPEAVEQMIVGSIPQEAVNDPKVFKEWNDNFRYRAEDYKLQLEKQMFEMKQRGELELQQNRFRNEGTLLDKEYAQREKLQGMSDAADLQRAQIMYGDRAYSPIGKLIEDQKRFPVGSADYERIGREIEDYQQYASRGNRVQPSAFEIRKAYDDFRKIEISLGTPPDKIPSLNKWWEETNSITQENKPVGGGKIVSKTSIVKEDIQHFDPNTGIITKKDGTIWQLNKDRTAVTQLY